MRHERVTLTVDGRELDGWTEYEVASDMFSPASGFAFAVAAGRSSTAERERLRDLVSPGASVTLQVRGFDGASSRQLSGIIDKRKTSTTRQHGTVYHVTGRDVGAFLADSDAPLDLLSQAESTAFLDVVRAAVDPWGLEVTADAAAARDVLTGREITRTRRRLERDRERSASGPRAQRNHANGIAPEEIPALRIAQAKPKPGQTVWDFLSAHAARLRLMLWISPDGRVVVGSPDYGQASSYGLVRKYDGTGNVLEGDAEDSADGLYSHIEVYGRTGGGDAYRSRLRAFAVSPSLPFTRRLVIHDQSIRTQADADARAARELMASELSGRVLSYSVEGHGQAGLLYAIDTIADVIDEPAGIRGRYYVIGRSFRRDRSQGTSTNLTLIPEGAIQL
ncbi:MAG: hypothetical protein RID81_07190 [Sandaracinaceae bacterium]